MLRDRRKKPAIINGGYEWAFVAVLVLFCVALMALQYHWTGQICKGETEQLRARFGEGLQSLCASLDSTLLRAYADLTPNWSEIDEAGHGEAHARLFREWKARNPAAIFKRIAFAVPGAGGLDLFILDPKDGTPVPSVWPAAWTELEANLKAKARGGAAGAGAYVDRMGAIQEFPVFARGPVRGDSRNGRNEAKSRTAGPPSGEKEWALFELDMDYIRKVWLAQLLNEYLGSDVRKALGYVEIRSKTATSPLIAEMGNKAEAGKEKAVTIQFHGYPHGLVGFTTRGREASPGWVLLGWQSPGKLADLVSVTRRENLAVGLLLNGLLAVAGVRLIRYTRQSRLLAENHLRFVANVSHELRTPLTVIRGASHNLLSGVLAEGNPRKIRDYVALIRQHAEDLASMVEQVLDLGRAKNVLGSAAFRGVDIGEVVRQAVAATQEETGGCVVDVQLAPNLQSIKGDSTSLQRAFQNLIANAAKHGGSGGWIGITSVVDDENQPLMVEVQVADRGGGIAPDELEKIFTPFYRGGAAEAGQVRGSGLGLSLVKEIVEAHGGVVAVDSELGRGTRFTVRLPLEEGEANA